MRVAIWGGKIDPIFRRHIHPAYFHIGLYNTLKRVIYTLIVAFLLEVSKVVNMITSRQIRAARALLGWSQQQLADKAIVSLNAVARLEKGIVDSRISTVQAVQKALVKAGIEFLDADQKGEGARLKSPKS
jgi:DNA-binding XRE family transcriptional regulator